MEVCVLHLYFRGISSSWSVKHTTAVQVLEMSASNLGGQRARNMCKTECLSGETHKGAEIHGSWSSLVMGMLVHIPATSWPLIVAQKGAVLFRHDFATHEMEHPSAAPLLKRLVEGVRNTEGQKDSSNSLPELYPLLMKGHRSKDARRVWISCLGAISSRRPPLSAKPLCATSETGQSWAQSDSDLQRVFSIHQRSEMPAHSSNTPPLKRVLARHRMTVREVSRTNVCRVKTPWNLNFAAVECLVKNDMKFDVRNFMALSSFTS